MARPFEGFRFWRFDNQTLDAWAQSAEDDGLYSDRLREIVDQLDGAERFMIERIIFGQATKTEAAAELGVSAGEALRAFNRGLEVIRDVLQEEDIMGSL